MNKEKVYIEGHVVGSFADTLGSKGKQIHLISGDIVDVDDSFIIKSIEPQKIKIPQFVADWIEEARKSCKDVADLLEFDFTNEEVGNWFLQENPIDLITRAWLDGYEVEKEPKYTVKVKGVYHGDLGFADTFGGYSFYNKERNLSGIKYEHTRKELEGAGFGEVFNSPLFEVKEVE